MMAVLFWLGVYAFGAGFTWMLLYRSIRKFCKFEYYDAWPDLIPILGAALWFLGLPMAAGVLIAMWTVDTWGQWVLDGRMKQFLLNKIFVDAKSQKSSPQELGFEEWRSFIETKAIQDYELRNASKSKH